jgi:drug/metabolite transporter (DMT)-like permease
MRLQKRTAPPFLIFDESLGASKIVGGAVILLGVYLARRR